MLYYLRVTVFILLVPASLCHAEIISSASVSSQGSFFNSAELVSDGMVPSESTRWTNDSNAYWLNQEGSEGVVFTIDYGQVFLLENVLLSVDNNDAYQLEYSVDNMDFVSFSNIQIVDGNILPTSSGGTGGMDVMSSNSSNAEYIANLDFSPVQMRYLRLYAIEGDTAYSVGEIQAFGTAVPEPNSFFALCALLVPAAMLRRRRRGHHVGRESE
ncbi:PEP-CTERM sorting domain-containing protein [Roseiconus lacunae]|uniref:PEP-CTERM sorting domain-containing protein n=1 Tax=Roseiconus lacunae TaxID=2605694 RepID=UPI00309168DA|nr:PEP-CTERM sorting domain-containing protein [Stieleria sp. HD01]